MKVILYDLAKKDPCKCWSLNPWKTRMCLHFKDIDYETKFLEFTEINPTFEPVDLEPNSEGHPYTIPTVNLDGKYIMDSFKIAEALEARQPSPSLHLHNPMYERVQGVARQATNDLGELWAHNTPGILNDVSAKYYDESRKERLGMSLAEWSAQADHDLRWKKSLPAFQQIADILKENPGPYFLGEEASYSDFFFVSFLHYLTFLNKELFERILAVDEAIPTLYKACEKYLARDDH